ncbi:MAG: FadR family transcriptional regulator [Sporomusaceae bacterium]|jgi:GntR family transcriptional repressor for pyruvate dehydrogenase complex|nr:FadR family transcriptional regulator [Sporomusaceae bacterium]
MSLEKIPATPKLSEIVLNALLQAIAEGKLKVGEELMPERELSDMLGVGRGSLRESLAILEFLGVLESRGNRKIISQGADTFEQAISLIRLSRQEDIFLDYIEFRCIIEPFITELACERADEKDLDCMSGFMERLRKDAYDMEADYSFHVALARATHNSCLAAVSEWLLVMTQSIRIISNLYPDRVGQIYKEHNRIFEAVKERNAKQAGAFMREHLDNIRQMVEANKVDRDGRKTEN